MGYYGLLCPKEMGSLVTNCLPRKYRNTTEVDVSSVNLNLNNTWWNVNLFKVIYQWGKLSTAYSKNVHFLKLQKEATSKLNFSQVLRYLSAHLENL